MQITKWNFQCVCVKSINEKTPRHSGAETELLVSVCAALHNSLVARSSRPESLKGIYHDPKVPYGDSLKSVKQFFQDSSALFIHFIFRNLLTSLNRVEKEGHFHPVGAVDPFPVKEKEFSPLLYLFPLLRNSTCAAQITYSATWKMFH